ncbi:DUF805 domain-containing protein [Shewanella eurypsychrophilus]|uniref:DUF805 domain-containing protein n=1 Tax=Shewanella eurypsychrophilus TaxID=2593656 RepID=A0ABX6VBD6_9GAMM|nr:MULTISPECIES: DUF805 domain-containing protein [Shewanella]QFU24805.1 DUF805 domain-containing protein [Shewanella sp. YLB-09]QPG59995.1 DUF805 domain-containing protein [Shewanella eurypsychrophilus]
MQYQSLLCIHGRDNGARFAVISASIYFVLIFGFLLIGQTSVMLILAGLLSPLLVLTTYRRVRDAARPIWYSGLPLIPLSLFSMALAFGNSTLLSSVAFFFALAVNAFLAMLASKSKVSRYQNGYAGPAAVAKSHANRRRVEPTLDADGSTSYREESDTESERGNASDNQQDWESSVSIRSFSASLQGWAVWGKQHPKILLSVAGGLLAITLLSGLWSLVSSSEEETVALTTLAVEEPVLTSAREEAKIPDGFSVLLEGNILIMRWLGETRTPGEIWSLASAQGDRSCTNLRFNNGTDYRTILVEYMPDTAIEARFSPLDTQAIITDIARRGSVKLCGYDFSLKGSQSALARNAAFIPYL